MEKTVNEFIQELQAIRPDLREKPIKISAPNGILFEPKIKMLLEEHFDFQHIDGMLLTYE